MSSTRNIDDSLLLQQEYDNAQAKLSEKQDRLNAMIIAGRNEQIRQLQREIEELAELMRDLNALIMEQGPLVDTIENNITKAADNTEAGVEQLQEASSNQSKRRKRIATVIAVVVTIGLVLGGGALIGAALGMSGAVGLLAGAAIMLAGLTVLAGIGYGIYSLAKCCMGKLGRRKHVNDDVVSNNNDRKRKVSKVPTKRSDANVDVRDQWIDRISTPPPRGEYDISSYSPGSVQTGLFKVENQSLNPFENVDGETLNVGERSRSSLKRCS